MAIRKAVIRRKYYCACGAAFQFSTTNARMAARFLADFMELHRHPGCIETDAKTAGIARRKAERVDRAER